MLFTQCFIYLFIFGSVGAGEEASSRRVEWQEAFTPVHGTDGRREWAAWGDDGQRLQQPHIHPERQRWVRCGWISSTKLLVAENLAEWDASGCEDCPRRGYHKTHAEEAQKLLVGCVWGAAGVAFGPPACQRRYRR